MILTKLKKVGNWYIVMEAGGKPVSRHRTRQQAKNWIADNQMDVLKKTYDIKPQGHIKRYYKKQPLVKDSAHEKAKGKESSQSKDARNDEDGQQKSDYENA